MCTTQDTTKTGINIDTVKESKLKPHPIFKFSVSNHLNKCKTTEELFKPTSIKIVIAITVVIIRDKHVIK
jgi:hypothetical protein